MTVRAYINDVFDPVFLQVLFVYIFLRTDPETGVMRLDPKSVGVHFGLTPQAVNNLLLELAIRGFVTIVGKGGRGFRTQISSPRVVKVRVNGYKDKKAFWDTSYPTTIWDIDPNEVDNNNGT